MNTYEADIWRSVYHNDKFSHTNQRVQLIHALSEERAKRKIILAEEKTQCTGGNTPITVKGSHEYLYRITKTGTVTKQLFYVYSDGRTPSPVKEKR